MFNSFSKTALRTIRRNKSFSALNITGLAVGIGASLLIFLIIRNELSYDTYHSKGNRIYRVVATRALKSNGEIARCETEMPPLFSEAMRLDFPQFEQVGALVNPGQAQIYVPGKNGADEKRFKEEEGLFFC